MSPENEPTSADEPSNAVDGGVLESLLSELRSEATDADRAALEESTPSDVEARIATLEDDVEALKAWRRSIVAHLE